MPAVLPIAMLGSAVAGGALSNRKQTQTQTQMPTLDPKYGPLQQMVLDQITQRLSSPSALPAGYETGQIGGINNTYNQIGQAMGNSLTARGLSTSPMAGTAEANLQTSRAGDIVRMQRDLPLVERQLREQDLAMANSILGQGRGSTTTSTTPGNMLGGGLSSLASMLAFMYGMGGMGGGKSPLASSPLSGGNVQWSMPSLG